MTEPLKVTAVGVGPSVSSAVPVEPLDVCNALAQWAEAAGVATERSKGALVVSKSDLLGRLIYAKERGPSQTPCPVHKGKWSGCHFGWPGSVWRSVKDGQRVEEPAEVERGLQDWYDAGCRCFTHRGSSCTTGWNPDENCCQPSKVETT